MNLQQDQAQGQGAICYTWLGGDVKEKKKN